MRLNESCCSANKNKIVQRQENGKLFRIINKNRRLVNVCRVDGCLIDDESIKCDFLFIIDNDQELYLVEMKGKDHVHALRQIISAAETLNIRDFSGVKKSAIVGASAPKAKTTYQNELVKLNKRFLAIGLSPPKRKSDKLEVEC